MSRGREKGKSGVFPPAIDPSIPSSWSKTKGDKRVCLHLLAGGRAEVGFLLLLCCHCVYGDVNGGLFSRGIHCAICACLVSNVFCTEWVLRRIGIHGCGRASCRSPVITHTRTVSVSLTRHVLQNGRNHLWDVTSFAASGKRIKWRDMPRMQCPSIMPQAGGDKDQRASTQH
ncbi:hypothetical protein TcG_08563 [Trypanosoma cruzi]|nr:hypothetical protein TcG_08563 [Trypanosoma cruzi]